MAVLADSDAFQDDTKILPQHQSAITLISSKLQNPKLGSFRWLDLACGKGQIISQLENNLSESQRSKLKYVGYDIHIDHTIYAESIAHNLKLAEFRFEQGDLRNFCKIVTDGVFDFITCTNTAHELMPGGFAQLFIDALLRLSPDGELFLYDMESLTKPELGALPLKATEIGRLINTVFEELNDPFRAQPSSWKHTTCFSWSVTIKRDHIVLANEQIEIQREKVRQKVETVINDILQKRLEVCVKLLESLCKYSKNKTADDEKEKISALHEFWAVSRILEGRA